MADTQTKKQFFDEALAAQPDAETLLRGMESVSGHGEVDFGSVDIVLIIALNEEFESIRDLLNPEATARGLPIQGVASTEFRFDLPIVKTAQTHSCLISILGDMGEVEAALATQSLLYQLRKHPPKLIANIGISGGTDSDVALGDVIVSQSVHRYLADSKTVDSNPPAQVNTSGKHHTATAETVPEAAGKHNVTVPEATSNTGVQFHLAPRAYDNRVDVALFAGNFKTRDAARFRAWQREGRKDLAQTIRRRQRSDDAEKNREAAQLNKLKDSKRVRGDPSLHRGPIGSGPGVGGSKELLDLIRHNNRKFLAIDMESGGFMAALRRSMCRPAEIILRGVSDFADERKSELDRTTGGEIRRLAMRNAFRLFLNLLDDDLLGFVQTPPKEAAAGEGSPLGSTGRVDTNTGTVP